MGRVIIVPLTWSRQLFLRERICLFDGLQEVGIHGHKGLSCILYLKGNLLAYPQVYVSQARASITLLCGSLGRSSVWQRPSFFHGAIV